jgi:sporulation protein YlmC with PRC-barrel domain
LSYPALSKRAAPQCTTGFKYLRNKLWGCALLNVAVRNFTTYLGAFSSSQPQKEMAMYAKILSAALISAALSTTALAQNAKSDQNQNASATGEWQASKLIHMNVYNSQNEKIGDIKELMLDKSGKIDAVAIGVGGFLGVGERDVAVKFEQLKWANEPAPSSTSSNERKGTTTGSNTADAAKKTDRTYPDHAVLNATKDQLKAMPQFNYSK